MGLLALVTLWSAPVLSEEYVVRIQDENGLPIIADIIGNHGVRHLPLLKTDPHGEWSLNTDDISNPNPTISFSNVGQKLSFSPATLTLSAANCPVTFDERLQRSVRLCNVTAKKGAGIAQSVMWRVVGPRGQPAPEMPVRIWDSANPCPILTDDEGYAIFSVKASESPTCVNESNHQYVMAGDLPGFNCTFTDTRNQMRICADGSASTIYGATIASCAVDREPDDSPNLPVKIKVIDRLNQPIVSVEVHIVATEDAYSSFKLVTNQLGEVQFSRSDPRIESDAIRVVLSRQDYVFEEPEFQIKDNDNNYLVRAVKTNGLTESGIIHVQVRKDGEAFSGVEVPVVGHNVCGDQSSYWTNSAGLTMLPVTTRGNCSNIDEYLGNDHISVEPKAPTCNFQFSGSESHRNYCPQAIAESLVFDATCGGEALTDVRVEGTVYDVGGNPFENVEVVSIIQGGEAIPLTATNEHGEFSFQTTKDSALMLAVRKDNWMFDAASLGFEKLSDHVSDLVFRAVTKVDGVPKLPAPLPCDVKAAYTVSGYVRDENNSGVPGVAIKLDDQTIAQTNGIGYWETSVEPMSTHWIHPDHPTLLFLPAGAGVYNVSCDLDERINFYVTTEESYTISGTVRHVNGSAFPGVAVRMSSRRSYEEPGDEYIETAITDINGKYQFTRPFDTYFEVQAIKQGYASDPDLHSGVVGEDVDWDDNGGKYDLDFLLESTYVAPSPSPSASPSASPSPSPSPSPVYPTEQPELIQPLGLVDSAEYFVWTDVPHAQGYHIEIADTETNEIRAADSSVAEFDAKPFAVPGRKYSWKVRALPTGPYSEVGEFTVRVPKQIPAEAPELISPIGIVDVVPGLVWKPVELAAKYRVWIQDRSTGIAYTYEVDDNTMSPPAYIVPGKRFLWKVTAGSEDGWGPESEEEEFIFNYESSFRIPPQCTTDDRFPQSPEVAVSSWVGEERITAYYQDSFQDGALNDDGRYFVFASEVTTHVENDNNERKDVFILDRENKTVERVSQTLAGVGGDELSDAPAVSGNGRFVAFVSDATNLADVSTGATRHVYVWDRLTKNVRLVSMSTSGEVANERSWNPTISRDGRWIVYNSKATNLVEDDTNNAVDTFLYDQFNRTTVRVSHSPDGNELPEGVVAEIAPTLSDEANIVTFVSSATPELSDSASIDNPTYVYGWRRDLERTIHLCTDSAGIAIADGCTNPSLSSNGRYLVFQSQSLQLLSDEHPQTARVFRKDLQTGAVELVSATENGNVSDSASGQLLSVDGQGRYVLFSSVDDQLMYGDMNGMRDMFLKDMKTGSLMRLSHKTVGRSINNSSVRAVISDNGQVIALFNLVKNFIPVSGNRDLGDLISWLVVGNSLIDQCGDQCPLDEGKLAIGLCGCGYADTDSDNNQTVDCMESELDAPTALSPNGWLAADQDHNFIWDHSSESAQYAISLTDLDSQQTTRFYSRNGLSLPISEALNKQHSYSWKVSAYEKFKVSEWSGTLDFQYDHCPDDKEKTQPGLCGCGINDDDLNENDVPDCRELSCDDSTKVKIDFNDLLAGEVVSEQYKRFGVSISARNNNPQHPNLAVVFDSSNPTGGDDDLGTPNEKFGGPGKGTGTDNEVGLGKLIIIAENDIDRSVSDKLDVALCIEGYYGPETIWVNYTERTHYLEHGASLGECEAESEHKHDESKRKVEDDKKVTICHIPPGNPANAHTITVSKNAVNTHIKKHGDYLGECVPGGDSSGGSNDSGGSGNDDSNQGTGGTDSGTDGADNGGSGSTGGSDGNSGGDSGSGGNDGSENAPPRDAIELCSEGATEVLDYVPGLGQKNDPYPAVNRQDTNKALGLPQMNDTENFVSLGRGGSIVLGFSGKALINLDGNDFFVAETSYGQRNKPCDSYPEHIEVFATSDGDTWHSLGGGCRSSEFDLAVAGLDYAIALKFVDQTTVNYSDGFDLDGITCVDSGNQPNPSPTATASPDPTSSPSPTPTPDSDDEDDNGGDDGGSNDRLLICHVIDADKNLYSTIAIQADKLEGHLAHGDTLGVCEDDDGGAGDGLIDNPDDESQGGSIIIDFDLPVVMLSSTVVDIEGSAPSSFVANGTYEGNSIFQQGWPGLGNNSVQWHDFEAAVGLNNRFINRLQLDFPNSGALADFEFCSRLSIPDKPKQTPLPDVSVAERCTENPGELIHWQISNPNDWSLDLHWKLFKGDSQVNSGIVSVSSDSVQQVNTRIDELGSYRFELYEKGRLITSQMGYSNECEPEPTPTPTPTPTPEPEGYVRIVSKCSHPVEEGKTLHWELENGYPIEKQINWYIENSSQRTDSYITLPKSGTYALQTDFEVDSPNVLVVEDSKGRVLHRKAANLFVCDIPRLPDGALQPPEIHSPRGDIARGSEGPFSLTLRWLSTLPEGYDLDYVNYEYRLESLNDKLGVDTDTGARVGDTLRHTVKHGFYMDGTYRWAVRVHVGYFGLDYSSDWSENADFRIVPFAEPFVEPPTPLTPSVVWDDKITDSAPLTYTWAQNLPSYFETKAVSYDIQLEKSDGSNPYGLLKVDGGESYSSDQELIEYQEYRWKIRATYTLGHADDSEFSTVVTSEWSDYRYFLYNPPRPAPLSVYGITPNDSDNEAWDNPPPFTWSEVPGINYAQIRVSTTPNMDSVVYTYESDGGTAFTPSAKLNPYRVYYWTVFVKQPDGDSAVSAPLRFWLKQPAGPGTPSYQVSGELRNGRINGESFMNDNGELKPRAYTLAKKIQNFPLEDMWVEALHSSGGRYTASISATDFSYVLKDLPQGSYKIRLKTSRGNDDRIVIRSVAYDGKLPGSQSSTTYSIDVAQSYSHVNFSVRVKGGGSSGGNSSSDKKKGSKKKKDSRGSDDSLGNNDGKKSKKKSKKDSAKGTKKDKKNKKKSKKDDDQPGNDNSNNNNKDEDGSDSKNGSGNKNQDGNSGDFDQPNNGNNNNDSGQNGDSSKGNDSDKNGGSNKKNDGNNNDSDDINDDDERKNDDANSGGDSSDKKNKKDRKGKKKSRDNGLADDDSSDHKKGKKGKTDKKSKKAKKDKAKRKKGRDSEKKAKRDKAKKEAERLEELLNERQKLLKLRN